MNALPALRTSLLPLATRRAMLVLCCSALVAPILSGQAAPPAPESGSVGADVVVLSPFVITGEQDSGYRAGNTLSGSRFNTRLSETPATINVFTEEFLQDIGATDLRGVLEYGVNSNVDYDQNKPAPDFFFTDASLFTDVRVNNRGLQGSQLLDLFETRLPIDTYNTGRFDLASGPNSVLFGISNAAGSVSVSTKRADLRRRSLSLRSMVGRWNRLRLEGDANIVVAPGRAALRIMTVQDKADSWRYWDFKDDRRTTLAATVVPLPKGGPTLGATYEKANLRASWSKPYNFADSLSYWLSLPESARLVDNSNLSNLTQFAPANGALGMGAAHVLITNNGYFASTTQSTTTRVALLESASFYEPDARFNTVAGFPNQRLRDAGPVYTLLPATPESAAAKGVPYAPFAVGFGPEAVRDTDIERILLRAEQKIGRHVVVELSYNRERSSGQQFLFGGEGALKGDPNLYLPNSGNTAGTAAAKAIPNPFAGQLYIEGEPFRNRQEGLLEAYRASVFGDIDLDRFGRHRVVGVYEEFEKLFTQRQGSQMLVNQQTRAPIFQAPFTNGNNRVRVRTYVTPGQNFAAWYPGPITSAGPVTFNGVTYDRAWSQSAAFGNIDNFKTKILASQSSFFGQRLFVSAGYRWDDYLGETLRSATLAADDPRVVAGQRVVGDFEIVDGEISATRPLDLQTRSIGAVLNVTPKVAVFANEATNVSASATNRFVLPDLKNAPPVRGTGRDAGLIFNLFNERAVLRLTYFETAVQGDPNNRSNAGALAHDRVVRALGGSINPATGSTYLSVAERDALLISRALGRADNTAFVDGTSRLEADGWEVDLKGSITKNWSFTLGYSRTNLVKGDIFPEFDGWWAEREKVLTKFGTPTNLVDPFSGASVNLAAELVTIVADIEDIRNVGAFGFNNRPNKFNVFTRYGFDAGRLKGFFVGGGLRWQDKNKVQRRVIGLETNTVQSYIFGDVIEGPEIFEVDALLGYQGRLKLYGADRGRWRAQINVSNLLDNDDLQILRYSADGTRLVRAVARTPRDIRLSVSLDF